MGETKIFLCLPILNESENIPHLLSYLENQTYPHFSLIACVNQEEKWGNLEDKQDQCVDNQKTIQILNAQTSFPIHIIDKSSKGMAWIGKQGGVGWARKLAMDFAADQGNEQDLIVSIDADTEYPENYLESLIALFKSKPNSVGLSNPYYHRTTDKKEVDMAILRYEIYMRNYAINMLLIDNPYQFTALGSAMATTVKTYKRVGGLSPKKSGEDFYFLQKLRKFGTIENWNSVCVYPAARFSSRVVFGTGPAMIKGNRGDWVSYPIYPFYQFQKVKTTYNCFSALYKTELETPMTEFLQMQLKREAVWDALRANYKSEEQFIKACETLVDGLRIIQFLKQETDPAEELQMEYLKRNFLYFSSFRNDFSNHFTNMAEKINLKELSSLQNIRSLLANFEYYLRQEKAKQ